MVNYKLLCIEDETNRYMIEFQESRNKFNQGTMQKGKETE